MHHPLRVAAFALWLIAAPVFLDPERRPAHYDIPETVSVLPDLGPDDQLVIVERFSVAKPVDGKHEDGPIESDEVLLPDLPPGRLDGAEPMRDAYGGWTAGVDGRFRGSWGPPRSSFAVAGSMNGGSISSPWGWGGSSCGCGRGSGCGRASPDDRVRFGPAQRLEAGKLVVTGGSRVAGLVFPLGSTVASADIAGWLASTRMIQTFSNPLDRPLAATYVLPLPASTAIAGFEVRIGSRRIVGVVRERADADAMFEEATARGRAVRLVRHMRSDVFRQDVAGIAPHADVEVTVTYVHPLAYEHGRFEYVFPMTAWQRSSPASLTVDRLSSPAVSEGDRRDGREVAVHVVLDAGAEIGKLNSPSHAVTVRRDGRARAVVDLARRDEIADGDFVLRWTIAGEGVRAGCVAHRAADGMGYFSAFLVPPADADAAIAGAMDVSLDPNGLRLCDFGAGLFRDADAGRPVFVVGRYTAPAEGDILFRCRVGGEPVEIPCHVVLPGFAPAREGLVSMWARERIADWSSEMRGPSAPARLRRRITDTALAAHLVSVSTSLVCEEDGEPASPLGR